MLGNRIRCKQFSNTQAMHYQVRNKSSRSTIIKRHSPKLNAQLYGGGSSILLNEFEMYSVIVTINLYCFTVLFINCTCINSGATRWGQEEQVAPPLSFQAVFPVRANPLRNFFKSLPPRSLQTFVGSLFH